MGYINMKRGVYIGLFVLCGILIQFLLHAGLEILYISRLLSDFETYGLGLSWAAWETIHFYGSIVLFIAGILFGYRAGHYWWPRLYDEKGRVKQKKWRFEC